MNLNYRRGVVQATNSDGLTIPKASYNVIAYAQGAMVNGNQTTATPTVHAGHGFTTSVDSIVVRAGAMLAGSFTTCETLSSTSVTLGGSLILLDGDLIYNLGADTGTSTPLFDGSTYNIYDNPNADSPALDNSTVTTNADGEYAYFYGGSDLWELVLTAAMVVADAVPGVHAGVIGPASSTDNALVRWDGTSGRVIQNYSLLAPTVTDAGAMTITSTLSVNGAVDLASTLAAGATTITGAAVISGSLSHGGILDHGAFANFAAQDATPSVSSGYLFKTANASATTITTFDDGVAGQEIFVVVNDTNTTFDFTSSALKGNAGVDWAAGSTNFLRAVYDGTNWFCAITDTTA